MPIYRVTGTDGYSGEPRELYVDAPDEPQAVAFAAGRAVVGGRAEQSAPQVIPSGTPVLKAGGWRPRDQSHHGAREDAALVQPHSDLLTRPVATIAKGVFLGIVFAWLTGTALLLLLSLLGIGLQLLR
ncbi:MAG: hypothetical protein H7Y88_04155 [Phycisphaerales bacterium]|nr:hypothetical protein [Phycisphaerales bacterium]